MDPVEALRSVAFLLEQHGAESYRVRAFRRAATSLEAAGSVDVERRIAAGTLTQLPDVGPRTASVAVDALTTGSSAYLVELQARPTPADDLSAAGRRLLGALRGDCHTHSDWSDGGSSPLEMATACRHIGHEWAALTDHSPRLTVARGLSRDRLAEQLEVVARVNDDLRPFRYFTGIEVDINEDGSLDQDDDLLARLDVVVASVHSKLRLPREAMTRRMVSAISNRHVDVLGHCTGRLVTGRGRPESDFDEDIVIEACRRFDVAMEINSRPERLDPPSRILARAVDAGILLAIDTDAHAPGQLTWQPFGVARAADAGAQGDRIVTTWSAAEVEAWTARAA